MNSIECARERNFPTGDFQGLLSGLSEAERACGVVSEVLRRSERKIQSNRSRVMSHRRAVIITAAFVGAGSSHIAPWLTSPRKIRTPSE